MGKEEAERDKDRCQMMAMTTWKLIKWQVDSHQQASKPDL
jgi:hypothetical protein